MFEMFYRPLQQKQTYFNILYLLTALPLGIVYFAATVIGLVIGITFSLVIVGLPLVLLVIVMCWYLAAFERKLSIAWLHIDIPPMAEPFKPDMNRWQRLQAHLNRPVTWKSFFYLFTKFLMGILAFELTLILLIFTLLLCVLAFIISFLIAPFVYLAFVLMRGEVGATSIRRYTLRSLTGFGLCLAPLYVINTIAAVWGQFSRTMLGMSDKNLRLAQATQVAEIERIKAQRAEQSRSELIINVSHELRTPIASIRGHIESLLIACDESENNVPAPEILRNYLNIVHRESIRLGALFDDLLSVARAETNELRVNISDVKAGEVIEEVYQTLMPLAKRERQIVLIRTIAVDLPAVKADRQRLMQVLLNLVRNAITYTPDGGIVSIALARADMEYLDLTVSDTGIGIPPEDQERIFERFYRTDASRARTSGGFGLGLAIVRDFVIAMGGTISVESTVNVGSCFHILLHTA